MPVFYSAKYQDANGRWIYTQNKDQKAEGDRITRWVLNKWQPHAIYYHFRSGGHVEAVRLHLEHRFFLKSDIHQFFNHVSRGKIICCLVKAGFSYKAARFVTMIWKNMFCLLVLSNRHYWQHLRCKNLFSEKR